MDNTSFERIKKITRKQKWEEKLLYGYFKQQTSEFSHEKIWTWIRKGHLNRETEFLRIAAQKKDIMTKYALARIDQTQQNSRCRLCGDHIYLTPPLGQDMTQGQFLSGV